MSDKPRQAAARKAGVPVARIAGPFDRKVKPQRGTGLYLRISPKTGDIVWSWYDAEANKWGLYSDSKEGARRRSYKHSKKQLRWFGLAK